MPLSLDYLSDTIKKANALEPVLELCKTGSLNDAKHMCEAKVSGSLDTFAAKHLLAILEFETGERDEALERIDRLIDDVNQDASLHNTLGHMFLDMEMVPEAEAAYLQAIDVSPKDFDAHWNLGNLMQLTGQMAVAEKHYREAVLAKPEQGRGHLSLGTLMLAMGQPEDARISLEKAVQLMPEHFGCLNNLGIAFMGCDRHAEAETAFLDALKLQSNDATILYHLGKLKHETGDLEEADRYYRQALAASPGTPMYIHGFSQVLLSLGKAEEAKNLLQLALDRAPQDGSLRTQLGLIQLRLGEFDQGWLNFEARRPEPPLQRRLQTLPLWRGETLDKKHLLVTAEGSLGDIVHFMRYLESYVMLGRRVTLEVPDAFLPVLKNNRLGVPIVAETVAQDGFDLVTRLMSMPLLTRQSRPTWPATGPYLSGDAELVKRWEGKLAHAGARKIALALSSREQQTFCLSAEDLQPLAEVPDVSFLCLCDPEMTADLKAQSFAGNMYFPEVEPGFPGWIETYAAILSNVDLLIASDGDIVHLASALGTPTWVLLSSKPNWRWGETSDRSDHYPNLRLFRQTGAMESAHVMRKISGLLSSGQ